MKKERQSNFELMRIVLMFMVLFWHVIVNIVFYHDISEISRIFWLAIHFLFEIHINTFIILTGYFNCEKENISINRLLKINNSAYFYKIVFLIILTIFFSLKLTKLEIIQIIQPITLYNQYWYIAIYLLLYLISPYLNKIINILDKKGHRKLILVLFLISSIIPIITNELVFDNNKGFSLLNFILMYIIGAYIRKYPVEKSYIFKKFTSNARKLIFFSFYIFFAILNLLVYYFGLSLSHIDNNVIHEFSLIIENSKIAYNNPILILESISFFLFFQEINIKSKIIDFIGKRTLDVYLIHDNQLLRLIIYKKIQLLIGPQLLGMLFFLKSFTACIIIFIVCIIIGFLREKIFELWNRIPLIRKRKEKRKKKIESLGLQISW